MPNNKDEEWKWALKLALMRMADDGCPHGDDTTEPIPAESTEENPSRSKPDDSIDK